MSCWNENIRVCCDEMCFDLSFERCARCEAVGAVDVFKERNSNKIANVSYTFD